MDQEEIRLSRLARRVRAKMDRAERENYRPKYIDQDMNPFWQYYFRKINDLDDILEEYLGIPLLCAEQRFGASLIFSYDEAPIWRIGKSKHGKAEARKAIQALVDAERVLDEEQDALGTQQTSLDHQHFRKNLASYLRSIPEPGNLMFDIDLYGAERHSLRKSISSLRELLEHQAEHELSGNSFAFNTALALRAVFEHYLNVPAKCNKDRSDGRTVIVGAYGRCLEEVFEIVGIGANVYAKGKWAQNQPESDPALQRYRQALRKNSSYCADQPYLFSEVGWVENVTPEQKEINSVAMNDKRLEYLLCYTKCSMEPDSTTMKTKS